MDKSTEAKRAPDFALVFSQVNAQGQEEVVELSRQIAEQAETIQMIAQATEQANTVQIMTFHST